MWFSTPIFVSCTTDASNLDFEIQNTTGSGSFITVPGSTFDMTVEGVDGFPGEYILLATFFTPSPVVCSVGILLSWSDCLSSLIAPQQNMSQSQSASQSTSASQSSSGSLSQSSSQAASFGYSYSMSRSPSVTPTPSPSAPRCSWVGMGFGTGDDSRCSNSSSCFMKFMALGGDIREAITNSTAFQLTSTYAEPDCGEFCG